MGIWKDFCRAIESKIVRRHFGDLVPLVNTSAVFEFSAEQISQAQAYQPASTDDLPVPPFPFPRMCCVGPGGVILLQSPSMDGGIVRYQTMVWIAGNHGRGGILPDGYMLR
jgi:hypothetical protein